MRPARVFQWAGVIAAFILGGALPAAADSETSPVEAEITRAVRQQPPQVDSLRKAVESISAAQLEPLRKRELHCQALEALARALAKGGQKAQALAALEEMRDAFRGLTASDLKHWNKAGWNGKACTPLWRDFGREPEFLPLRGEGRFAMCLQELAQTQIDALAVALRGRSLFSYDFQVQPLDGAMLKLSDLRGKPLLLCPDFDPRSLGGYNMGGWNPGPILLELHRELKAAGLRVLAFASRHRDTFSATKAEEFYREEGKPFPLAVLPNPGGPGDVPPELRSIPGDRREPTFLLFDGEGHVVLRADYESCGLEAWARVKLDLAARALLGVPAARPSFAGQSEPAPLPYNPAVTARSGDWSGGVMTIDTASANGRTSRESTIQTFVVSNPAGRGATVIDTLHWLGMGWHLNADALPSVRSLLALGPDVEIAPGDLSIALEDRAASGRTFKATKLMYTPHDRESLKRKVRRTYWVSPEVKAGGVVAAELKCLNLDGPGVRGEQTWSYEVAGQGTGQGTGMGDKLTGAVEWGRSLEDLLKQVPQPRLR